jgi:hypothetical protein
VPPLPFVPQKQIGAVHFRIKRAIPDFYFLFQDKLNPIAVNSIGINNVNVPDRVRINRRLKIEQDK